MCEHEVNFGNGSYPSSPVPHLMVSPLPQCQKYVNKSCRDNVSHPRYIRYPYKSCSHIYFLALPSLLHPLILFCNNMVAMRAVIVATSCYHCPIKYLYWQCRHGSQGFPSCIQIYKVIMLSARIKFKWQSLTPLGSLCIRYWVLVIIKIKTYIRNSH